MSYKYSFFAAKTTKDKMLHALQEAVRGIGGEYWSGCYGGFIVTKKARESRAERQKEPEIAHQN